MTLRALSEDHTHGVVTDATARARFSFVAEVTTWPALMTYEALIGWGFPASRLWVSNNSGPAEALAAALRETGDRAILAKPRTPLTGWASAALIGRESSRLGWRGWRDFLVSGEIGASSQVRFVEIARAKLGAWRPFAYKAPREGVLEGAGPDR